MLRKKGIALAISLAFPAASFALGLGAMKTSSQLSQPFSARIELLGATASELEDITVKLADASQFQRAGLALNAQLLALRFEVINDPKGDYVKVSTRGPVNEPVLDFIVELRSPSGTILREYAVLLDPPSYAIRSAPQRPAAAPPKAPVAAAAPATPMPVPVPAPAVVPSPAVPAVPRTPPTAAPAPPATAPVAAPRVATPVQQPAKAAAPRPAPAPVEQAAPAPRPAAAAPRPKPTPPPPPPAPAEPLAEGAVALNANETLWEVAKRYRPSAAVSVPQMMIAIQRANPEAFPDNNVRNIRPGATLAIPDEESIASVSEAEADAEVQRQVARWRERRLAIASRPAPQAKPAAVPAPTAETKPSARETSKPAAAGGAGGDARLEIVAPGSKSGAKSAAEAALRDEHAAALASEMAELRARLDEAAGIIDLLENQVKLKNEELTRLKQPGATAGAVGAPGATGSAGAGTSATPAEAAAVTVPGTPPAASRPAAPVREDVIPEPSEPAPLLPPALVEAVPGGWLGIGGLLAAVLAGIGLLARRRRPRPAAAAPEPVAQQRPAPVEPEPVPTAAPKGEPAPPLRERLAAWLSRFRRPVQSRAGMEATTQAPILAVQVPNTPAQPAVALAAAALAPMPLEADPLEEVNIYLAYERFDQAEELVRKVIAEQPDNPDYRLRLLEVLQAAGKQDEFEGAARELRGLVEEDDPRWEDARAFWDEFDTGRELLAEAPGGSGAPLPSTPAEALESTQTGLMQVDDDIGLKAEEALDELDALLGSGAELPPGMRDVLDLGTSREGRDDVAPAVERQPAAARAEAVQSSRSATPPEPITATELDFDLGGLDLGATGEVDLDVASRAKAAESALDLAIESESAGLGTTLPPTEPATTLQDEAQARALDLDLDLDFGDAEGPTVTPDPDLGSTAPPAGGQTAPAPQPTPVVSAAAAAVATELEEFDLSLEGDLAASLDLAAELGLKDPTPPPARPEPEPAFEPLPEAEPAAFDDLDLSLDAEPAPFDDLDLSLDSDLDALSATGGPGVGAVVTHGFDLELEMVDDELDPLSLESSLADEAQAEPAVEEDLGFALDDETDTKLNLAKAYIELGEAEAARSILGEVISEGEPGQRAEAQRLLSQIG